LMKQLVEVLIKALVDDPSQVDVQEIASGRDDMVYEVRVAEDDMGKVIGKHGRIVKAIRTVVRSVATREGKRVAVEIVE